MRGKAWKLHGNYLSYVGTYQIHNQKMIMNTVVCVKNRRIQTLLFFSIGPYIELAYKFHGKRKPRIFEA